MMLIQYAVWSVPLDADDAILPRCWSVTADDVWVGCCVLWSRIFHDPAKRISIWLVLISVPAGMAVYCVYAGWTVVKA